MHMLSLLIPLVTGHPSGLAGGRASCGLEFNTPQDAYIVQDAREAWYLRRIQTCEAPFFWTTFSTVKYQQDVLISVLSPEVDRFADKLMWKAVIFNDNLPELTQKELDGLPDALIDLPGTTGMVIMSDVDKLNAGDCSFVDNRVMKKYADEVTDTPDGKKRCMELLDLPQTYAKSTVLAGNTWRSWWMYSYDHKFFHVGDYRMVSWIEARDSPGTLVSGRYEITIAPHIWYGYAPDEMMRSAHDQISTCTCGANYPLYNEQATTRVGWSADDAKVLFENEITYGECSATGPTDDDGTQVKCFASTPSVDTNAILEWGGRWSLAKGSYTWTLRAEGNDVDGLEYHEPKMDVFVVKAGSRGDKTSLDVNHRDAQVAISGEDQKKINAGGTIAIAMSKPGMKQTLVLDNSATTTTYKLEIDTDGDYLIYTEHMPWEFAAMVLEDTAPANPDARFIWAVEARDYVVTDTQAGVAFNTTIDSGDSGRTVAPITSNTTIDDGSLLKEVSRLENEMKAMYAALAIAKVSKLTCSDGMVQAQDTEAGIGFVCTLPCVAGKDRRDCEDDYCVSNGAAAPNAKKKLVGLYVVIGIVCVVAIVVGVVLKVNGGAEGGGRNIYNSGANQQHHQFANPLAADTPVSSA